MENFRAKVNDNGKLVLFVDPKVKGELSGTGKSYVIAKAHWFDLSDIPGCEGLTLHAQVIRKIAKKKAKAVYPKDDNDDDGEPAPKRSSKPKAKTSRRSADPEEADDFTEKKTRNKGRKPQLNRDAKGNVKPIASSKRPADKLRTKRGK